MTSTLVRSSTTTESDLLVEIMKQARRYAMSEMDLTAFNEWYAPIAWSIETSDDRKAEELVDDITLMLSEYDQEQWSEDQLKELLLELVMQSRLVTYTVHKSDAIPTSTTQEHPYTSGWPIQWQKGTETMAENRL